MAQSMQEIHNRSDTNFLIKLYLYEKINYYKKIRYFSLKSGSEC